MSKKNFDKFVIRNVHKRKAKDKARGELISIAAEYSSGRVEVRDSLDLGRRGRVSPSARHDETAAEGVFSSTRSGFGFVRIGEGERDIFIPEGKTYSALDGDLVSVVYHEYENRFGEKKTEGRVTKILAYGRKCVIGTVDEDYRRYGKRRVRVLRLIPDDARFYPYPEIVDLGGASVGDKVEGRLLRHGAYLPECEVVRVFGPTESKSANYEAILAEADIVPEFTDEELSEAENAARVPLSLENRKDRRGDMIFTMDGADAKDLDDAVSLVRVSGGGYRLGVHIADVSHYVRAKSALDRCVMARGTSVYFTDKVVPMLPPVLSNGACSLNAGEDKYAVSAIIRLSDEGEILGVTLEESVINSRVRGVYSEINALLDGDADPEIRKKYKAVTPTLLKMRELYEILRARRIERSYIDFDSDEARILLDKDGEPIDITLRQRGISERMIEEFMLTANEAVARYMSKGNIPCVYRIHDRPPADKYEELVRFAHNLGFTPEDITSGDPCAKKLALLLKKAEQRGIGYPVSYMMLRSMSKAKYSEVRSDHFGLGLEYYCHFTSPIRRLSDLATHRILKAHLGGEATERYRAYARRAAAAASEAELRAMTAERRIEDLYKVVYMSRFIGECFEGAVSSVSGSGMFVRLSNTVVGLVPMSALPGEFFYDEGNMSLVSKKKVYRLGEPVTVRVEECDIVRGNVEFSLAYGESIGRGG